MMCEWKHSKVHCEGADSVEQREILLLASGSGIKIQTWHMVTLISKASGCTVVGRGSRVCEQVRLMVGNTELVIRAWDTVWILGSKHKLTRSREDKSESKGNVNCNQTSSNITERG